LPIVRIARSSAVFGPDDIATLTQAYETALKRAGITDRTSLEAEALARAIVEAARDGERNVERLRVAATAIVEAHAL
jgi:hypothetical protein